MKTKKRPPHLIRAMKNTCEGIYALWKKEYAFRLEIYISVVLIPLIIFLQVMPLLKLGLVLLLLLLLTVEALNSALEAVVDRISLEIHAQSKLAKDMGSAAVGIVIIMNIVAWGVVLFLALAND